MNFRALVLLYILFYLSVILKVQLSQGFYFHYKYHKELYFG